MSKLETKKIALSLGIVFAILHAIGLLAIQADLPGYALRAHFLSLQYTILPFNIVTYIKGVLGAFIGGALLGWLYAAIYNRLR